VTRFFRKVRRKIEETLQWYISRHESAGRSRATAISDAAEDVLTLLQPSAERTDQPPPLPPFDEHGYLPAMHRCTPDQFRRRFGHGSERRRVLMQTAADVFRLCREADVRRIMVGGSFITAKERPGDVDVTALVYPDFLQIARSSPGSSHHRLHQLWDREDSEQAADIHLSIEHTVSGWWTQFRGYFHPKGVSSANQELTYAGLVEVLL